MAGDAEQTDSSGKYTFGGGGSVAKKYWPTILKSIELVSVHFFYAYCDAVISQAEICDKWKYLMTQKK